MEQMYELEFNDSEIGTILNSLDFYSRIWIVQYEHILYKIRWEKNCRQLDRIEAILQQKLWGLRCIVLPELRGYHISASFGIFSPKRNVKAAIAYDMQQEFRYRRAWYLNPKGDYTVDFGTPLPCKDDPCEFPKAECYDADGEFRIRVYIAKTQLMVICDALNIMRLLYLCQIEKLYEYYTDSIEALNIAKEITEMLKSVETDKPFNIELYSELSRRLIATAENGSR